jgi:hypothetical protein
LTLETLSLIAFKERSKSAIAPADAVREAEGSNMSAHSLQQLNEARHEEIRRIQSQLAYLEQEKRTLNERLRMVLGEISSVCCGL